MWCYIPEDCNLNAHAFLITGIFNPKSSSCVTKHFDTWLPVKFFLHYYKQFHDKEQF